MLSQFCIARVVYEVRLCSIEEGGLTRNKCLDRIIYFECILIISLFTFNPQSDLSFILPKTLLTLVCAISSHYLSYQRSVLYLATFCIDGLVNVDVVFLMSLPN